MHSLPGALLLLLVGVSADLNIQVQILAPYTLCLSAFVSNLQALAAGNATNATNCIESPASALATCAGLECLQRLLHS